MDFLGPPGHVKTYGIQVIFTHYGDDITQMLNGAGIFNYIKTPKMAQFCR
jgi:hypothetical protein